MAKKIPPLTDTQCRGAKYSTSGGNKLFDGGGLYLELLPSGEKRWRLKYRHLITGKDTAFTFGSYPAISLTKVRTLRDKAKTGLLEGRDPSDSLRNSDDSLCLDGDSFENVATEWLEIKQRHWSPGYLKRINNALIANAYPRIGSMQIQNISGKDVLDTVRVVENRGSLEMAARVLEAIGMVFRYAVGTGKTPHDVTAGLRQFLQEKPPVEHFPHVSIEDIPDLLRRVDAYHGRPETKFSIQLMLRTFPRTNELRWAEWCEVDFDNAQWIIPASRMKGSVMQKATGADHIIPLSRQCLKILRDLHAFSGRHKFLFPGIRNPNVPMSSETINKALKIMGFGGEQTGHGFRGLASTIMNEYSNARPDVIERQLAHKDRNKIRRTYNHALYIEERTQLMQWWSDYLDEQKGKK